MEKYHLTAFRVESSFGCSALLEKSFNSIASALRTYYFCVGSFASSLSNCVVCSYDEDVDIIKKVRISNHDNSIFVYLQKLS